MHVSGSLSFVFCVLLYCKTAVRKLQFWCDTCISECYDYAAAVHSVYEHAIHIWVVNIIGSVVKEIVGVLVFPHIVHVLAR